MNNFDVLINKYVDDELSGKELDEFNELLENDENFLKKLKAHKLVHAYLKEIDVSEAPASVTGNIMHKINSGLSQKLEKNYFFFGVLGVMTLSLLGSIIFFFSYFGKSEQKYTQTENVISTISNYINNFVGGFTAQFADANIMLIVSTVTLILMLGIYFLFESRKSFRKKLHTLS
jgi:hypothetical protein